MATNTKNLNLIQPTLNDFYNIEDFNNNFEILDEFAGRKDNPHGVTAEQINAAPVINAGTSNFNMDAILKSGEHFRFYRTTSNTLGTPYKYGATLAAHALILSYGSNSSFGYQIAFMSGGSHPLMRYFANGTITEWSSAFLPLTGGTLKGDLNLTTSGKTISLLQELGKSTKTVMGSYVGTSSSSSDLGANYPVTITFDKKPKFIILMIPNKPTHILLPVELLSSSYSAWNYNPTQSGANGSINVKFSNNTLTFYESQISTSVWNKVGETYYHIAINEGV